MTIHRCSVRPQFALMCFGSLLALTTACTSTPSADGGAETGTVTDTGSADAGMISDVVTDEPMHSHDDGVVADVPPADVVANDVVVGDAGDRPIHNCTAFVDRTDAASDHTIAFTNFQYMPNCMTIAVGQTVTFNGNFVPHPMRGGVAPSRAALDPAGTTPNPIVAVDTGTTASFVFAAPGLFPFYCLDHEGTGMFGVVRVH